MVNTELTAFVNQTPTSFSRQPFVGPIRPSQGKPIHPLPRGGPSLHYSKSLVRTETGSKPRRGMISVKRLQGTLPFTWQLLQEERHPQHQSRSFRKAAREQRSPTFHAETPITGRREPVPAPAD